MWINRLEMFHISTLLWSIDCITTITLVTILSSKQKAAHMKLQASVITKSLLITSGNTSSVKNLSPVYVSNIAVKYDQTCIKQPVKDSNDTVRMTF